VTKKICFLGYFIHKEGEGDLFLQTATSSFMEPNLFLENPSDYVVVSLHTDFTSSRTIFISGIEVVKKSRLEHVKELLDPNNSPCGESEWKETERYMFDDYLEEVVVSHNHVSVCFIPQEYFDMLTVHDDASYVESVCRMFKLKPTPNHSYWGHAVWSFLDKTFETARKDFIEENPNQVLFSMINSTETHKRKISTSQQDKCVFDSGKKKKIK